MSGPKAYTMREMKGIVDYLVEQKAYSEIKGRKMWVNFANSSLTTRTWQSLKETFLKRILPDVQNPYYRLTRDQVYSFRQGIDVEAKEKKNRLEIRTTSEESSSNADNQNDVEQPSTSHEKHNEEKTAGEDIKSEKISARNRSSADTFILDEENHSRNSHDDPDISKKTTEELLAEFDEPATKSLKECLDFEYSEPPSVVRDVLNDFETDSEGSIREAPMEIVELEDNTDPTENTDQVIIVVEDTENIDHEELIEDERIVVEGGKEVEIGPSVDHEIISEVTSNNLNNWLADCAQEEIEVPTKHNDIDGTNAEQETDDTHRNESHEETEAIIIEDSEKLNENPNKNGKKKSVENENNNQNSLSTTSDTIIPNNQEVLNNEVSTTNKTNGISDALPPTIDVLPIPKDVTTRKRSTSQDNPISKKLKLDNGVEKTNGNITVEITPPSSNNTEVLFDALKRAETTVEKVPEAQDAQDVEESPQNKNPCLKSVSLFEEQFNTTKYTDSEDEETPIPKNDVQQTDNNASKDNQGKEVVTDVTPNKKQEETVQIIQDEKQEFVVEVDLTKGQENDKEKTEEIELQEVQTPAPAHKINQRAQKPAPAHKKQDESKEVPKANENQEVLSDSPVEKKKVTKHTPYKKNKDVIVLKSNSDSDEEETDQISTGERSKERLKSLAKALGFIPGTSTTAPRKRSLRTHPKPRSRHHSSCLQESSDWEDIMESEPPEDFVPPPRGRRNRYGRMYKKPVSGRILSSEDEGRLFVVLGNKVYPLVKGGKDLTYVNYDDSDGEEESVWRQKYIEERRKAAELKRQLERAREISEASSSRHRSPILTTNPSRNIPSSSKTVQDTINMDMNKQVNMEHGDSGKIQITLSKNSEEKINLEGHWPQVLPMVQQMMSIFYKSDGTVNENTKTKQPENKVHEQRTPDISGLTTPIIPVVETAAIRKVDDLENQIFKEIEQRAKEEGEVTQDTSNVTKRKPARPKKTPSTSSEQSETAAKRPRRSKQNVQKKEPEDETQNDETKMEDGNKMADANKITEDNKIADANKMAEATKMADANKITEDNKIADANKMAEATKMADTYKVAEANKMANEIGSANQKTASPPKKTRKTSVATSIGDRLSVESANDKEIKTKTSTDKVKKGKKKNSVQPPEKVTTPVKYNIGPIEQRVTRSRKSGSDTDASSRTINTRQSAKPSTSFDDGENRYMGPPRPRTRQSSGKMTPNKTKSPENPHEISQDCRSRNSVDSTQGYQDSDASPAKVNATKKKRKISITVKKGKHIRRKSLPTITVHDMSIESSNSPYFVPRKSKSQSFSSSIYKTESYQVLMGNRKLSLKRLDVIDEKINSDELKQFDSVSRESSDSNIIVEIGSSSNVSLPLSPELSVVENLSISREIIQSGKHPTINETQANNSTVSNLYNQYMIADMDVSIPLMQQECELLKTPTKRSVKNNSQKPKKPSKSPIKVSQLLNKVCTVNLSVNNTLCDSLEKKLHDLLLESSKKISETNKENLMDVDESQVKSKKGGKRCSTPQKRNRTKNTKVAVGPVIDEHMESCSFSGRNSCPPVVTFIPLDENAINSADVVLKAKPKPKAKAKKNIIKVKIQKPEKAKIKKRRANEIAESANTSGVSVYTDSGINETASISGVCQESTDSVELIHNHSETCLQAHECIDSVEFVDYSKSESVVSIASSESSESELLEAMENVKKLEREGDCRIRNAQDVNVPEEKSSGEIFGTPADTIYHSPVGVASNCSLITEDLSDDATESPTEWYLLSEDDTNINSIRPELMTSNTRVSNYSALKQLFPITCAVPNLSTISEMSRGNEDSRKGLDTDGDTRNSDIISLS